MINLQGIIVPLITPLTARGELDEEGLARLVERLLRAGVHGFFAGGTTGEFLALPAAMRARVFQVVARAAAGAAPVVAGISAACLEDILHLAGAAAEAGAGAVSLLPPPFFPLTEAELGAFYENALARLPLPAVLYNFPLLAGKAITPALVGRFAGHPHVIGMKDSSGDFEYFTQMLAAHQRPEFRLFIGCDSRLAEAFALGAAGGVPSVANVAPEPCVRIYQAARRCDLMEARAAQDEIAELIAPFKNGGASWLAMIRWIKQRLHEDGVCEPHLAPVFGMD